MCMISVVETGLTKRLQDLNQTYPGPNQWSVPVVVVPALSNEELVAIRKLLESAKLYDAATGQQDCEHEDKRAKLLELAEELGAKEAIEAILEDVLDARGDIARN